MSVPEAKKKKSLHLTVTTFKLIRMNEININVSVIKIEGNEIEADDDEFKVKIDEIQVDNDKFEE